MSSVSDRLAEIAGQIGQISEQLGELQQALEASRSSLDQMPEAPAAWPQPTAAGQSDVEFVNQALRKLAYGKNQERILEIFLEEAQPFVSRAILFLLRDGQYVTWKGFGFEPGNIKEIALDDPADSVVRSAQQRQLIYRRDQAADSLAWLNQAGDLPNCTLCIPLVFENSAPVVFYADSDDPIAIDSLELLSHLTVLVLKNDYLHQLVNAHKEAASEAAGEEVAAAGPAIAEEPVEGLDQEPYEEPRQVPEEEQAPEPLEAQAEEPSQPWQEAVAEEEPTEEEPQAEPAFEAAAETEPGPEAQAEPASEPFSDFGAPSEEKEIDFDEELAAAEREIDFDIDLDTTPEIEDWRAAAAQEQQEAGAGTEEAAEAEPQEPQEDLEFQPFGAPQEAEAPQEEVREAEPFQKSSAFQEPEQQAEAYQEPEPYVEPSFDEEAAEPAAEAAPEEEAEAQPELEPQAKAEPETEPQPQEAVEAQPAPEPPSSEEEKKAHDEARRFARLLVSEIKLYNEDEVEAGRQNGDLYRRLARDITRSRNMYQDRVDPSVSRSVDYFHEEMVRILAKGDAGLLGGDYPGPQTAV